MKKEFERFFFSNLTLQIWLGEKLIFKSKKEGVRGLVEFIKKYRRRYKNLIAFDKVVGNAAALLFVYLKVKEVYGIIGSNLAKKTLRKYKIKFYFKKTISNILNKEKTDICPMEKISKTKTPEGLYKYLIRND